MESINDKSRSFDETCASYDHIFIYCISGEADIIVNEDIYRMKNGGMIIIPPGDFYCIKAASKFEIVVINFDFDDKYSIKNRFYIKPDNHDNFNPDKICKTEAIAGEECLENVIFEENFNYMDEYVRNIYSEFRHREKYYDVACSHIFATILVKASRNVSVLKLSDFNDRDIADVVLEFIYRNYNKDISNESIAGAFNFNHKYLNRLVKEKTGRPIHKHIIRRRISKSVELLLNTNLPVCEIAEQVGFSDPCHFSKCFKSILGKTPNEYRNNNNM